MYIHISNIKLNLAYFTFCRIEICSRSIAPISPDFGAVADELSIKPSKVRRYDFPPVGKFIYRKRADVGSDRCQLQRSPIHPPVV